MDSYYALGATSVPMRKSRLVTAIRFSMCLHYNRFRMRKQATQPKLFHIFSTYSRFSQSLATYYNFFTTCSLPPFSLYTLPLSEKTEAVKVQGMAIGSTRKKFASVSADWRFSAKFFHLDGEGFSDTLSTTYFVI